MADETPTEMDFTASKEMTLMRPTTKTAGPPSVPTGNLPRPLDAAPSSSPSESNFHPGHSRPNCLCTTCLLPSSPPQISRPKPVRRSFFRPTQLRALCF
ncbi:hypothetical protein MTO96_029973 [Rhipicephalus appendiculatus]